MNDITGGNKYVVNDRVFKQCTNEMKLLTQLFSHDKGSGT